MLMTDLDTSRDADRRHAWLGALIANPETEVERLLRGAAAVWPYHRAEPSDAAAMIFAELNPDDPAFAALAKGLNAWFDKARQQRPANDIARENLILMGIEAFGIVGRLSLGTVAARFWREYPYWFAWVDRYDLASNADLRGAYFRALALTQSGVAASTPRRIPFWLGISRRAGRDLPDRYIDIGLLGLRALPIQSQRTENLSNESLCVTALAEWVEGRRGMRNDLIRRWRTLKIAYPHQKGYWEGLYSQIVAPRAHRIAEEVIGAWRHDLGLADHDRLREPGVRAPSSVQVQALVSTMSALDWRTVRDRAIALVDERERYARLTGITEYLVKTACNLGNRILRLPNAPVDERAAVALKFALSTLRWELHGPHGWSLWRDALAARGDPEGAEIIAWDSIRRFPDNARFANDLARMWLEEHRWKHAEALLRDTIERTGNVVASDMLAQLLMRSPSRHGEAEAILRAAIEQTNFLGSRNLLAALLMRNRAKWDDAEILLRGTIEHSDDGVDLKANQSARNMLAALLMKDVSRHGEAETILKETLQRGPNNYSRDMLAQILLQNPARVTEARRLLRESAGHGSEDAKQLLSTLDSQFDLADEKRDDAIKSTMTSIAEKHLDEIVQQDALVSDDAELSSAEFEIVDRREGQDGSPGAIPDGLAATPPAPTPAKPDASLVPEDSDSIVESIRPFAVAQRASFFVRRGSKHEQEEAASELHRLADDENLLFARFLLLGSQPSSADQQKKPEPGSFGLLMLDAMRRASPEAVDDIETKYPEEELVCNVVRLRFSGTPKLRERVQRQLGRDPQLFGSASRAMIGLIKLNGLDAVTETEEGLPYVMAALGACFTAELAA